MAINFNGKRLVKPQAELKLDTSAMVGAGTRIGQTLCMIGTSLGGEPGVVQSFTNPALANAILRGGDLLTAAKIAWNPSPSQTGATEIKCIRVNPAVAASVSLKNSVTNVLKVTAKDAGIWTSSLDCKVEASTNMKVDLAAALAVTGIRIESVSNSATTTVAGITRKIALTKTSGPDTATLKLGTSAGVYGSAVSVLGIVSGTVTLIDASGISMNVFVTEADLNVASTTTADITITPAGLKFTARYAPTNAMDVQDNLGPVFSVRYTGAAASCAMDIAVTSGVATGLTMTPATGTGFSIDFTDARFDSLIEIVNLINSKTGYSASLSNTVRNSAMSARYLDTVSAVPIKNINRVVTAKLGSIIDWADRASSLVVLTKETEITVLPPDPIDWTSLTGGAEGTVTSAQWIAALALLETEDVDIIVPLTTISLYQDLVKAHVDTMSLRKKERRAYYGHALTASITELKDLQTHFNDRRSMLVTPGIELRDSDGNVTLYNSNFTAAALAGIVAGFTSVADSLTYKYINALRLEKIYTDLEIDELINSGIVPVEKVKNRGFRISYGRTTYTYDDISVNVEDSVSRIGDYITIDVRSQLENTFVGTRATKENISAVKTFVRNILKAYEKSGLIVGGTDPVTGQPQMAYSAITVDFADRVCSVSFQVSPVEPMNYILITAAFKPNTISA